MNLQIKQVRESRELSQQAMANELGIPVRRYGSWERGERNLNLEDAARIADVLECTLDELAGREWPHPDYADPRQTQLNDCFEGMNDAGKDTLTQVARSLERDTANRIVKDRQADNDQADLSA